MQKKLTLRLDEELIKQAKIHAGSMGKSVSRMVADYFASFDKAPPHVVTELTPTVRSLKGVLRDAAIDEEDYRRHLEDKHL